MFTDDELAESLRRVREIDRLIDLSKSTIQLEILLFLGLRENATINDIVTNLNYRRKAITDALRKLCKKELIVRRNEELYLTEQGRKYIENLLSILGFKEIPHSTHPSKKFKKLRQIINNLSIAYYIHETLLYLALSPRKMASIETLSQVVNLSPQRLRTYLDLYTNNPNFELKLFKVIYKNTWASTILRLFRIKKVG